MLAILLVLLAAPAQPRRRPNADPVSVSTRPRIPFEKYTLGNGLTVIVAEDHRVPVVGVDLWYHVGAADEQPGRSGFAHLFEHLMFQGSKHVQGDERAFFSALEKNGASLINGSTDWDRTNYYETVPADRLELALWLESDRMGFLLDALDQKKLDAQRDVVRNERRQTIENVPYGRAEERLCQLLFPKPHPYYGYINGSHDDLKAASLEDVRAFFRTYYTPNNATLAIVGDFEPGKVKALVEKWFGPIARGPATARVAPRIEPRAFEARETLTDQVRLAKVMVGFVGPAPLADPALPLAVRVLGGGKASWLYHDLVYEKKIAQDVQASFNPAALGGIIEIAATVQVGHTPQEVEAALLAEIKRLREAPPSEEELARAKRALDAQTFLALEHAGGDGRADLLDWFEMWKQDPGYLAEMLAQTRVVTAERVRATAAKYLGDAQRVVLHVLPAAPGGKEAGR